MSVTRGLHAGTARADQDRQGNEALHEKGADRGEPDVPNRTAAAAEEEVAGPLGAAAAVRRTAPPAPRPRPSPPARSAHPQHSPPKEQVLSLKPLLLYCSQKGFSVRLCTKRT